VPDDGGGHVAPLDAVDGDAVVAGLAVDFTRFSGCCRRTEGERQGEKMKKFYRGDAEGAEKCGEERDPRMARMDANLS
jgi:hypothetical protein